MKVEVKKTGTIQRELSFEIPKERVSQKMEEVYKDISKIAKVKGYRPGKVPRQIIEEKHGAVAKQEVIEKLIPEVYQEGIKKEQLFPIDYPEIVDVNLKDGILTFKAKFDIKPEVKIKDYKQIKVERKSSQVTDEDINKTLDYFKQGQGKDSEVKIDDEFAKGLGYPNLEEFKKFLTRQLEMDKDRQNKIDVESQIIENLLKKVKLDAPPSLVKRHLDHRVHDAIHRLEKQGMAKEEIAKKEEEIRKEWKPHVEKDVKVYLIIDKIAELENIQAKEGESMPAKVMEFLLKEAQWEEAKS